MPDGTDLETTDAVIRKFEDKVLETGYDKEMTARISPDGAYLRIAFPPEVERSFRPHAMKEELIRLATQFAGLTVGIYGFDPQGYHSSMAAGTYFDSQIKFLGYDLKKLRTITDEMERTLRRNPRIREVRTVSNRWGWMSHGHVRGHPPAGHGRRSGDSTSIRPGSSSKSGPCSPDDSTSLSRRSLGGRETDIVAERPRGRKNGPSAPPGIALPDGRRAVPASRGRPEAEERPVAGSIEREDRQFQRTVMWEFRGPFKAAR